MLTPSQQSVLIRPSHTAIIANAGSGKTRVLVEQYITFLLQHPEYSPREVVTITFSEQSAKDIKKKIREGVLEKIESETDDAKLKLLYRIHDRLQSATITTIHAFAAQLLRNYPVESKTDSMFAILTSPEDQLLREECVQQTLYRALSDGYENGEPDVIEFVKKYSRRSVTGILLSLFSSRFTVGTVKALLDSKSDRDISDIWLEHIESTLENNVLSNFDTSYYDGLLVHLSDKTRGDAELLISAYQGAKTLKDKLITCCEILDYFHTGKWDSIHGTRFKKVKEELLASIPEGLAAFRDHRSLIESYCAAIDIESELQKESRSMRILVAMFYDALTLYNERKEHYSLLDFDDMLWKAKELLERPEIHTELSARYPLILVDEYQDTDDLQYEIIRSLTGSFMAPNRLIVVGDPKQSIYGFRNANIALFNKTCKEIGNSTSTSPIELKESFRMLAAPMTFINALFEYVFTEGREQEVEYNELILSRPENAEGSVEMLIERVDAEVEDDEKDSGEVELIARKILQITNNENGYRVEGKEPRPITFHDIGILLRSRTQLEKVERTLRSYGIPYVTYGGRGFYTSQEIKDIINYLAFLVNPVDDVALFGVLRSPYFNISDTELFTISATTTERNLSFWKRVSLFVESGKASDRMISAYEALETNLELVGKLTSTNLIEKIYTESMIFGIYELYPESEQKTANLRKFSELSMSFHSSGFQSTYDFLERILLLSEREEEEALAESLTHANAVHIMTIHASKGLEFPIVFLPFLHRRITGGDARKNKATIERSIGISLYEDERETSSPLAELIKLRSNQKGYEEEKRIFYVAATRARDRLILSGRIKKEKVDQKSYLGWIASAFDTALSDNIIMKKPLKKYDPDSQATTESIHTITISLSSSLPVPNRSAQNTIEKQLALPRLVHTVEIPYEEGITRYSPSQLLVYRECPTKYHLRFNLGIPEDPRLSFNFEAADSAEALRGTVVGQLVHAVLQHIDTVAPNGVVNDEQFTTQLRSSLESLGFDVATSLPKYSDKIGAHIDTFINTEFGKLVLSNKTYFTEHALRAKLTEKRVLSGIIDRLYKDKDGWHILDYKTDRNISNTAKDERYRFQMKFYAYLVAKLFDIDTDINTHLFYTNYGVTKDYSFMPLELSAVEEDLTETVSHILRDKRAPSLTVIHKNREHCPDCGYFNTQTNRCLAES
jgi:ATP-dependent helicase/nuclease subunit A